MAGLSKEAFIGTAVVFSTFVDLTQPGVYATRPISADVTDNPTVVLFATLSAVAGAYLGNKFLKKVALKFLQVTVTILLVMVSVAFGAGWISCGLKLNECKFNFPMTDQSTRIYIFGSTTNVVRIKKRD